MVIKKNQIIILTKVKKADTFWLRLKGLLGRNNLGDEEGLLITNCSSVHCFFMKFTIDVIYLDKEYKVLAKETIKPFGVGRIFKGVKHVLEVNKGKGELVQIGEVIEIE